MMERNSIGQFVAQDITLVPNFWLGYFSGLVLGDGWLLQTKSRNYRISIESTQKEIINAFRYAVKRAFGFTVRLSSRVRMRRLPNGEVREDQFFSGCLDLKTIYEALRPFKSADFVWNTPTFLSTKASRRGFLRGIFDAEGSICLYKVRRKFSASKIEVASKHEGNVQSIAWLLAEFKIFGLIQHRRDCFSLVINDFINKKRFAQLINFGLSRKRTKLSEALKEVKKWRRERNSVFH